MESLTRSFQNVADDLVRATGGMSSTTWAVIAVGTVVFGYVMLKGMKIQR